MAIQPIDLSTMYSQLDNVAKFSASQAQHSQNVGHVFQEQEALQDLQKSQAVQQAAKDGAETGLIRDGGGNGQGAPYSNEKKKNERHEEEEQEVPTVVQLRDPMVGQHVDITG